MADEKRSPLALILMVAGLVAGAPGFFVEGEKGAIFLLPVGIGLALGGLLLAADYRGSVALFSDLFWGRRRLPMVQGRWQMRAIGVVGCIIGLIMVTLGMAAFLDAVGVVNVDIEG